MFFVTFQVVDISACGIEMNNCAADRMRSNAVRTYDKNDECFRFHGMPLATTSSIILSNLESQFWYDDRCILVCFDQIDSVGMSDG